MPACCLGRFSSALLTSQLLWGLQLHWETKVWEFDVAVVVQEDVLRFQVSVDDVERMEILHGLQQSAHHTPEVGDKYSQVSMQAECACTRLWFEWDLGRPLKDFFRDIPGVMVILWLAIIHRVKLWLLFVFQSQFWTHTPNIVSKQ